MKSSTAASVRACWRTAPTSRKSSGAPIATGAGAIYPEAARKVAVLVKTTRNAVIGFAVLGYAVYWASRGQAQAVGNKAAFLW
jgi:hypothetical protein